VKWLFASAGARLADGARVFNMRTDSAGQILEGLEAGDDTGKDATTGGAP
jgi:hypothetical protein